MQRHEYPAPLHAARPPRYPGHPFLMALPSALGAVHRPIHHTITVCNYAIIVSQAANRPSWVLHLLREGESPLYDEGERLPYPLHGALMFQQLNFLAMENASVSTLLRPPIGKTKRSVKCVGSVNYRTV